MQLIILFIEVSIFLNVEVDCFYFISGLDPLLLVTKLDMCLMEMCITSLQVTVLMVHSLTSHGDILM